MQQVYVLDGKATVAEAIKQAEKESGEPIKITGFYRFALGDGIEKKQEDFAAEVAKTVGAAAQAPPAVAPPAPAKEEPKKAPEVKKAEPKKAEPKKAEAKKDAKPAGKGKKK